MKNKTYLKTLKNIICISLAAGLVTSPHAEVISDFNDGVPDWDFIVPGFAPTNPRENDGSLILEKQFTNPSNGNLGNNVGLVFWNREVLPEESETVELTVDIVDTSGPTVMAGLEFGNNSVFDLYFFGVIGNSVFLDKGRWPGGSYKPSRFFHEEGLTKNRNITLKLGITNLGDSFIIRSRVLDKDDMGKTLFDKTILDSPDIDPTLPSTKDLTLFPESGSVFNNLNYAALLILENTDGEQPPVWAKFDNFTMERKGPEMSIRRAIQLTWPQFETEYSVQGATNIDGPWVEVGEPDFSKDGMNYLTIPTSVGQTLGVFRLATP